MLVFLRLMELELGGRKIEMIEGSFNQQAILIVVFGGISTIPLDAPPPPPILVGSSQPVEWVVQHLQSR